MVAQAALLGQKGAYYHKWFTAMESLAGVLSYTCMKTLIFIMKLLLAFVLAGFLLLCATYSTLAYYWLVWIAKGSKPSRSTGVLALACWQRKGALTREARGGEERGPNRKPARDRPIGSGGREPRSSGEASNDRGAKGPP